MTKPREEIGVIELLLGTDHDGDDVYAYLNIPLAMYDTYRKVSETGEIFDPAKFGTILAKGKGTPTAAVTRRLAAKYNLPPEFESTMMD